MGTSLNFFLTNKHLGSECPVQKHHRSKVPQKLSQKLLGWNQDAVMVEKCQVRQGRWGSSSIRSSVVSRATWEAKYKHVLKFT